MSLASTSRLAVELLLKIQSDSEDSNDDINHSGVDMLAWDKEHSSSPKELRKGIAQLLHETFEEIIEADYRDVREHINALFHI
ncbi:hypothetical protein UY3_04119 [Chelonia mydas]|uniref:Uncharacterized protein n=1 Tax=Chelonia mydas TaxID=8469 RepID=M7BSS8_CHEMY|nr:hypothetical protein UY3_04119 [Chelonia mydas]